MADTEKAIRILEGNYKNFVLRHNGELITVNELLALLKAQEPRVMTLEEVMALEEGTGDVWIEDAPMPYTSHWIEAVTLVNKTDWQKTDEVTFSNEITYHPTSYRLNTAQGWRCWTSRPTDEQREAAKWE